jgi:hypothetical protein
MITAVRRKQQVDPQPLGRFAEGAQLVSGGRGKKKDSTPHSHH